MKKIAVRVRIETVKIAKAENSHIKRDVHYGNDVFKAMEYLGKVLDDAMCDGFVLRQCGVDVIKVEKPRKYQDDDYVSVTLTVVKCNNSNYHIRYGYVCSRCSKENAYAVADFVRKEILVDSGWEEE